MHHSIYSIQPNIRSLHTTSYQSAIVTIALSCSTFQIFDVEEYRDLEIQDKGHSPCKLIIRSVQQGHQNWNQLKANMRLPISLPLQLYAFLISFSRYDLLVENLRFCRFYPLQSCMKTQILLKYESWYQKVKFCVLADGVNHTYNLQNSSNKRAQFCINTSVCVSDGRQQLSRAVWL